MKRAYVEIAEGQVHYRYEGVGEPLLLLHQVAWSSQEFSKMLPMLAESYRVIAVDILGYGSSDHPPREYQIPDYAKSVVEFLDALGIAKLNIFGHHTGALIAVELAAAHPNRVDKLVLSGCPCFKTQEERMALLDNESYQPMKINAYGGHLSKIWHTLRSTDYRAPLEISEAFAENYIKAGVRGEEGHWAAIRYDAREKMPLIQSPTLALSGTRDMFYLHLDDIRSLIRNCRTVAIEGAGAFICQTHSEVLAQFALDFLYAPGT